MSSYHNRSRNYNTFSTSNPVLKIVFVILLYFDENLSPMFYSSHPPQISWDTPLMSSFFVSLSLTSETAPGQRTADPTVPRGRQVEGTQPS